MLPCALCALTRTLLNSYAHLELPLSRRWRPRVGCKSETGVKRTAPGAPWALSRPVAAEACLFVLCFRRRITAGQERHLRRASREDFSAAAAHGGGIVPDRRRQGPRAASRRLAGRIAAAAGMERGPSAAAAAGSSEQEAPQNVPARRPIRPRVGGWHRIADANRTSDCQFHPAERQLHRA